MTRRERVVVDENQGSKGEGSSYADEITLRLTRDGSFRKRWVVIDVD